MVDIGCWHSFTCISLDAEIWLSAASNLICGAVWFDGAEHHDRRYYPYSSREQV